MKVIRWFCLPSIITSAIYVIHDVNFGPKYGLLDGLHGKIVRNMKQ